MTTESVDTILVVIAPEMAAVSQPTRYTLIEIAAAQVGAFSCNATIMDLATAYLAAHTYTISQRDGFAGQVTSETEGSLSRSYGSAGGATGFHTTSYGAEFMRLVSGHVLTPVTRQVTNYYGDC